MITLRRNGALISGRAVVLAEYEPLDIIIQSNPTVSGVPAVMLDGVPLQPGPSVSHGEASLLFTWTFRAECWCGRIGLVATNGLDRAVIEITVRPARAKLHGDDYDAMLNRLLARDQALAWGLAPGQVGGSLSSDQGLTVLHPIIAGHMLPALLQQLQRIVADPVLAQRPIERLTALRAGLRLDAAEQRWLLNRPDRRRRLRAGDPTLAMLRRRREHSLDHPANRWVVGAVARVRRALLQTTYALTNAILETLERARADALIYQAQAAVIEIDNVLDRSAFSGIPRGTITESVSLVLADQPMYARLHRLVRRLLASSVRLDEAGGLEASLRRTWDLFEIDCLYRLTDHLELALGPAWNFHHAALRHGILAEVPRGRFWHADDGADAEWALYSQQTFPDKASGTASISTERRPDFVLVRWQGGALVRWVLLDAAIINQRQPRRR